LFSDRRQKPLRVDAALNRARVLQAARELFATRGPQTPLDEVARLAGVGPGTVHRHFPTKAALLAAIIEDRIEQRASEGLALADAEDPRGLFVLLEVLLDDGRENLAVKAALSQSGFDLRQSARSTAERLDEALRRLLEIAQRCGTASRQLDVDDVKATLVATLAAQEYVGDNPDRSARMRELFLGALRGRVRRSRRDLRED
jgi:AcrR family transcriptional regulator